MKQNERTSFEFFDGQQEENQDVKREKKQKLVRNEFKTTGKYDFPIIKKQNIEINNIEPWCFIKAKANDTENMHKTIHFFTYDWQFESVYTKPEIALEKLDQYFAIMTPGFSTYTDMPLVLQAYSTFKNRWCGAFWQKHGLKVIPTIEWGDKRSFEFCFDGIEENCVVAVSTYSRENYKKEFMAGYNKMLEVIKPSAILCYGEKFSEMGGNVKVLSPYDYEKLIKQMGLVEYTKRLLEKDIYPSN